METPSNDQQPAKAKGGNRKGNKSTNAVVALRVDFVLQMIVANYRKSEIKKACKERFKVGARMAEHYFSRAMTTLENDLVKNRREKKAIALAFYQSILRDPKASYSDKIKARRSMDNIEGIARPKVMVATQNNFSMSSEVVIDGGGFLDQPLTPELKMIIDAMTPEAREQFEAAAEKADNARLSTAG